MAWDRIKGLFGSRRQQPEQAEPPAEDSSPTRTEDVDSPLEEVIADSEPPPEVAWIEPSANPWGVPLLDVRPVTLGMLSASSDPTFAQNLTSMMRDDGVSFIGVEPPGDSTIEIDLKYPIDSTLADGVLFTPDVMEHKWAIFLHQSRMIFVRSWTRQVVAVADVEVEDGFVKIVRLRGRLAPETEGPRFDVRMLDYLIRSHALGLTFPAPLPEGMDQGPSASAFWCMSFFGNRAWFAASRDFQADPPEALLRTNSLLHIAAARGDVEQARRLLDEGTPAETRDRSGAPPLHWAVYQQRIAMFELLLDRGSLVDSRSQSGATTLMLALEIKPANLEHVAFLLDRGADPNAADDRGFTPLHRAAERGEFEIVRMLLDHGASPSPIAEGDHTPRSLAETRQEKAVVELLDAAGPRASDKN